MTIAKTPLNINKSLFLSVVLHGGLLLIAVLLAAPQISPVPIGMELRYNNADVVPANKAAQRHASPAIATNTKDDDRAAEKTAPVAAPLENSASAVTGSSQTGALTGREGVANGSEVTPEERYVYELQKLLERRKNYPVMAKKMGHAGTVTMRFTMLADGSVSDSEIVDKSPYASLNQAALELVRSIHGLKPFPPEIHRTSWSMTIPIRYQLN